MPTEFAESLLVFACAAAIVVATIPLFCRIAKHAGMTAPPAPWSEGSTEVPLLGGAPIVLAILMSLAVTGASSWWLVVGLGGLLVVGIVDDAIALTPLQKLFCQTAIIGCTLAFALHPFHFTFWRAIELAAIFFWLLATSNSYNLIDGIDGLAAGVGVAISLALVAVGYLHGDDALTLTAAATAGALSGFVAFNFPPASIFMGDAGALPIGFLLGALALRGAELSTSVWVTKLLFPPLVMLVPLLDTTVVCATRLATGKPISRRGLDHSHHRLLAMGLSDRQVVAVCVAAAAAAASCAVAVDTLPDQYVLIVLPFILLAAAIVSLFMMDITFEKNPPGIAFIEARPLARFLLAIGYKRRIVEAAVDAALIGGAYFGAFFLRLNFFIPAQTMDTLLEGLPWVLGLSYLAFWFASIYRGIWRHTEISDVIRFANGSLGAGALVLTASWFLPLPFSGSVLVLFVILLFNLLVATRVSFQLLRRGAARLAASSGRALIVGATESGAAAANYINAGHQRDMHIIGFVDSDVFKHGKLLHGQEVLGSLSDVPEIWKITPFDRIVVAEELSVTEYDQLGAFAHRHRIAIDRFLIQFDPLEGLNSRIASRRPAVGLVGSHRKLSSD
jgi:UDP-GlcNAc:undecaprenyl-phosphate GlcNAc-1-phosphate transferase